MVPELEKHGLRFVGQDETQERMEIMELAGGKEGGEMGGGKEGGGREGVGDGESLRWEGECRIEMRR